MKKTVYRQMLVLFTLFETLVYFGLLLGGVTEIANFFEVNNTHFLQTGLKIWAQIVFFISVAETFYKTKGKDPFYYQAVNLFSNIKKNLYSGLSIPILVVGAFENKGLFLMLLIIFLFKKISKFEIEKDTFQEENFNEKNS
ncbi:hypothetical protein [Liquorilactobacillus capillatus]|nr:hypothetical protein [Liquorilactobacillus capillatus]